MFIVKRISSLTIKTVIVQFYVKQRGEFSLEINGDKKMN